MTRLIVLSIILSCAAVRPEPPVAPVSSRMATVTRASAPCVVFVAETGDVVYLEEPEEP